MKTISIVLIFSMFVMIFGVNLYAETSNELYNSIVQTYKAGDYNKSIDLSKKFVKTYKNDEKRNQVLMILGVAFAKVKKTDKAIRILEYHDKKYPDFNKNDKVELLLGKLYYNKKDYVKAENILNKMISRHKDSKNVPMAETILTKIRSKNTTSKSPEKVAVNKVSENTSGTEYSFTKITWAKIGAGVCLIAAPVFYLLGNSAQNNADSLYSNEYMNATTADDATTYYNQVVDNDKQASLYNNIAIGALVAGAGLFAVDYFSVGRVSIGTTGAGSLKIQYSQGF